MIPSKQTLQPDDLQDVLDAAANGGRVGTQQFLTPPALAKALALPLPAARVHGADFTIGTGELLRAADVRTCMGVDIDSRAIKHISENPDNALNPHQTWNVAQADFTLLFDLLCEASCKFQLLTLNPPFSPQWDNKRFAALGVSEWESVRACYKSGAAHLDGTSAMLLCALDRLSERGEGYMICNKATAIRLLGKPGEPAGLLAAIHRHIWLWLDLPEGTFPDARFEPCVLYFAPTHDSPAPLHLVSPSPDPTALLAPIARQRVTLRTGFQAHAECHYDADTLPKWRACLNEYRTIHGKARRPFNLWIENAKIQRHLTPFQGYSGRIPRADAVALDALHDQSPYALVMQKASRVAMLRAVRGTLWRVDPALLDAVDTAMESYHAARAPLYSINDVQRLGWLDEEDSIVCKLDFAEVQYRSGTTDEGKRYHETTGWPKRLAQQKCRGEWHGYTDRTLRKTGTGALPKALTSNWLHAGRFASEVEVLEWLLENEEPGTTNQEPASPCFLAGQSYSLSTATRKLERPHQRQNAVTGENEECTLHGHELVIEVTDARGRCHEFGDFTDSERAAASAGVACHSLEELVEHFLIPAVSDVSQVHSEKYRRFLSLLEALDGSAVTGNASATDEIAARIQTAIRNNGFKFRRYQKEDMARGAVHGSCLLGWEPGLGKTLPLLLFGLLNGARRHLLVSPESLHDQTIAEAREKFGIEVRRLNSQDDFATDMLLKEWLRDHLAGRESDVRGVWITSYSQLGYNGGDQWKPKEDDDGELLVSKKIQRERQNWPGWREEYDTGIGEVRHGIRCLSRPTLSTLCAPVFDYVGCDEAVRLKANESFTSLGVRHLNPRYRLVLTGTPIKNHLDDIFWLLWWSAGGHPEPTARFPYAGTNADKEKFAREFMFIEENHTKADEAEARTGVRRSFKRRIPLLCNLHRLWKLMGPCVIRRRKDAIGEDIVPKTIVPIAVRPGTAQQAVYSHHLRNPPQFTKEGKPMNPTSQILAQLSNLRIAALCPDSDLLSFRRVNLARVRDVLEAVRRPMTPGRRATIAKALKVLGLASGTPFEAEAEAAMTLLDEMLLGKHPPDVDSLCKAAPSLADRIRAVVVIETQGPTARSWTDFNPKQAAILAKIAELIAIGEQVVVMAPFQDFGRALQRRLEQAGVASLLLDGDISPARRGRMAALFKKRRYAVLIGGIKSMGEGHSFECASHLILPSIDWAYDQNRQAEDRVHRLNSTKPVTIYAMVTENTVDVRLAGLYREKGDASSLALDGRIKHDEEKQISLADLLRDAVRNFAPSATTIDEQDIEAEWCGTSLASEGGQSHTGLCGRLALAMRRFREWHPPIDETAPVTPAEIKTALLQLDAPAAGERLGELEKSTPRDTAKFPHLPVSQSPRHLLKGVPDATLRWLLGVSPSMDVSAAREAFEKFAASRGGDWRRLWGEFEQAWKRNAGAPARTDNQATRAALAALRKLKP